MPAAIAPAPAPPPPAPAPAPKPSTRPAAPPPSKPPGKPAPAKQDASDEGNEQVNGAFDNAFADLDAIEAKDTGKRGPKPKPTEKKPDEEEVQEDESPLEDVEASGEVDDKAGDEAPPKEAKPVRAAELRTAYEKSKVTLKERDAEITRLKGELESKTKEDPEKKGYKERVETLEKQVAEYEEEVRFTNYRKSKEFSEKYEKPYQDAFSKALREFTQISIADDEGNKRPATEADLNSLLSMSIAQVDELATEKFGPSAARVVRHVEKLRDLADSYHQALETAKTTGAEREKLKVADAKRAADQYTQNWTTENEGAKTKYPHFFAPVEGDEELNTALEKGYKFADTVFLHRDQEPPERLVKMDAAVRNKAAAFGRVVLELKRTKKLLAEREAALKEFESSEPAVDGEGVPAGSGGDGGEFSSAYDELDKIEAKTRK